MLSVEELLPCPTEDELSREQPQIITLGSFPAIVYRPGDVSTRFIRIDITGYDTLSPTGNVEVTHEKWTVVVNELKLVICGLGVPDQDTIVAHVIQALEKAFGGKYSVKSPRLVADGLMRYYEGATHNGLEDASRWQ